ncbi:hypothetical protein F4703DRAFT_1800079, partial [Phycomyces blakesleeanus]
MLIVFCMLLVPSVQVKHQGSDQSPRLSVSNPSRSSFKVQVKVNGFRSRSTVSVSNSIQVKHQGSDQSPRFSGISKLDEQLLTCFCIFLVSIPSRSSFKVQVKVHRFSIHSIQVKLQGSGQGPRFQYLFHPGQASRFTSRSTVFSIQSIQEKHQCSDLPAMVIVSAIQVKCQGPDFPAMGCSAIDVRRQGSDLSAMCSIIQVNQQDSDLPSMCSANNVKRPGSHLPAMVIDCSVIQVKHLGSDRQSMVKAIQVKHQGSTRPSMCWAIQVEHQGSDRPSMVIAIRVKHQGPDRPSMVIVIRMKRQGPDRTSMVI